MSVYMAAPTVPTAVDCDLYERLSRRPPDVMCRVFNHFYEFDAGSELAPGEYNRDGWRKYLAGTIPEGTRAWLETHEQLSTENVSKVHATTYLVDTYDVPEGRRDTDSVYELAILIHELGLEDDLTEIIVASRIRQNELKRTWTLDTELSLSDLTERINGFHGHWNDREDRDKAVLVKEELAGDSSAALHIYAEKGAGVSEIPTFGFRKTNEKSMPATPELVTIPYRELKDIRLFIRAENGQTRIVFTSDHTLGWKGLLDGFFEFVFGVEHATSALEQETVTEAVELQDEASESVELDDEPIEQVGGLIDERSAAAIEAVEDSEYGDEQTQRLKQKLQSIELSGSEVEDDPGLGTEEFRLIGRNNLEEVFEQVDIEDSFLQFIERASDESLALVLSVDGRHVAARATGPQPVDGSRLGNDTQVALRYFFERDGAI
jgi:hypothetical protein